MTTSEIILILTNVLEGGGLACFIAFLFRGMKHELMSLQKTILEQSRTIEVMERRVSETEKVGDVYRKMINELPEHVDKYSQFIAKVKNDTIDELQKAVEIKDQKLRNITEIKLKELEIQERILSEIPAIRQEMLDTMTAFQARVQTMVRYEETLSAYNLSFVKPDLQQFERWASYPERQIKFAPTSFVDYTLLPKLDWLKQVQVLSTEKRERQDDVKKRTTHKPEVP